MVALLTVGVSLGASAHFQLILPSDDCIAQGETKDLDLQLIFTHPMEASHTMDMGLPADFGVLRNGTKKSLVNTLEALEFQHGKAWQTTYRVRGFGDLVFYLEPAPYWEPMEDKYITQCTKVVVNALGMPTDWDAEVGLPAEIVPLTRPYGLWTGNVFQGTVKKGGDAVPYVEIEVEYLNAAAFSGFVGDVAVEAPADAFVTQVIKADGNGVFTFGIPRAGWWGFAALMEGEEIDGNEHELGAVMWIRARDMS
jgi:cobalt/nickel transport protein